MVHYECGVCSAMATCVLNEPAQLAWLDHMANHSAKTAYSAWYWDVVPLPLDLSAVEGSAEPVRRT